MTADLRFPRSRARADGWTLYLLIATCLVPVLIPQGPGQLAIVDGINALALGIFLIFRSRDLPKFRVPFLGPAILILVGSLLAVTNARSLPLSLLTLVQDVYLYVWFILLTNLMTGDSRLRLFGSAWTWTAMVVVVLGVLGVVRFQHGSLGQLLSASGARATSTFTNPNAYADYLMLSVFIALSLTSELDIRFSVVAIGTLLFGLLSTKSNGGIVALVAGLGAYALVRVRMKGIRPIAIAGAAAIGIAILLAGWTMVSEWGIGSQALQHIGQESFAGRMAHSGESRMRIWVQLRQAYARSPLGIGPGNSSTLTVQVGERERPGSLQSKEAHNDYLGFAIERGPIGLAGLIWLLVEAFRRVTRFWRRRTASGPRLVWGGAFTAAMVGGLVASSVHSLVIEKWHFRHYWLFLAFLCAVSTRNADEPAPWARVAGTGPRERARSALPQGSEESRPTQVAASASTYH